MSGRREKMQRGSDFERRYYKRGQDLDKSAACSENTTVSMKNQRRNWHNEPKAKPVQSKEPTSQSQIKPAVFIPAPPPEVNVWALRLSKMKEGTVQTASVPSKLEEDALPSVPTTSQKTCDGISTKNDLENHSEPVIVQLTSLDPKPQRIPRTRRTKPAEKSCREQESEKTQAPSLPTDADKPTTENCGSKIHPASQNWGQESTKQEDSQQIEENSSLVPSLKVNLSSQETETPSDMSPLVVRVSTKTKLGAWLWSELKDDAWVMVDTSCVPTIKTSTEEALVSQPLSVQALKITPQEESVPLPKSTITERKPLVDRPETPENPQTQVKSGQHKLVPAQPVVKDREEQKQQEKQGNGQGASSVFTMQDFPCLAASSAGKKTSDKTSTKCVSENRQAPCIQKPQQKPRYELVKHTEVRHTPPGPASNQHQQLSRSQETLNEDRPTSFRAESREPQTPTKLNKTTKRRKNQTYKSYDYLIQSQNTRLNATNQSSSITTTAQPTPKKKRNLTKVGDSFWFEMPEDDEESDDDDIYLSQLV